MKAIVIGVAGATGSGKTTVSRRIIEQVSADSVAYLQHDSYYKDRSQLTPAERERINFEYPNALETTLLIKHLQDLRAGRCIEKPIYDFATHTRRVSTVHVEPRPVVIVEGILVLADAVLREMLDLKLYVDTDADIRLIRRVRRDIAERGRTFESGFDQYLATVRPMHMEFVEPSKRFADLVILQGYNPQAVNIVVAWVRDYLLDSED